MTTFLFSYRVILYLLAKKREKSKKTIWNEQEKKFGIKNIHIEYVSKILTKLSWNNLQYVICSLSMSICEYYTCVCVCAFFFNLNASWFWQYKLKREQQKKKKNRNRLRSYLDFGLFYFVCLVYICGVCMRSFSIELKTKFASNRFGFAFFDDFLQKCKWMNRIFVIVIVYRWLVSLLPLTSSSSSSLSSSLKKVLMWKKKNEIYHILFD